MKILVFSDSHGELRYMTEAVTKEQPDQVFHLGDHALDAEFLSRSFPLLPIVWVRGNCDWSIKSPLTRLIPINGLCFFLCHGHSYHVKESLLSAVYAAREQQADVLLFGHTHVSFLERTPDGLTLFNPGCCYGRRPSYGVILVRPGNQPEITIKTLEGE